MNESFRERMQNLFRNKQADSIEVHRASEEDHAEEWPVLQDHPELVEVFGPQPEANAMKYIRAFLEIAERSGKDPDYQQTVGAVLYELETRSISDTLPLPEEEKNEFLYRRHVELATERKAKVAEFLGLLLDGKMTVEKQNELLEHIIPYFGVELKKALWAQKEFYPKYFEHAIAQARGDVMQFLIGQANIEEAQLSEIRKIADAPITLKDPLIFHIDNPRLEHSTGGVCKGGKEIDLKIPTFFDQRDEWGVYLVAVHELVHSVSTGMLQLGMWENGKFEEVGTELNEAVTELVTYAIVNQHMQSEKQGLMGLTKQRADVRRSGYGEYVQEVQDTLGKISLQTYIDAMITYEGFKTLKDKFDEEFGEGSLIDFARKLKESRDFKERDEEEGDRDNVIKVKFGKEG